MDLNYIFNYIKENTYYYDREESLIAGVKFTPEEYELQDKMNEFTFSMLHTCVKNKKYYYDPDNYFENYTLYLKYNNIKIVVYIIYGQGNYYTADLADNENYKEEYEFEITEITNEYKINN